MFFQKEKRCKTGTTHTCISGLILVVTVAALTVVTGCTNLNQSQTDRGILLDRSNAAAPRHKSHEDKAYEYASYLQFGNELEQKKAIKNMTRLLCSRRSGASRGKAVVTQSLIHTMHSDRHTSDIRERSAEALREAKDANARHALINALGTVRDRQVRKEAAASLGKMRDPKSVRYLEYTLLNDSDKTVRGEAAKSLAKIGDESCVPTLLRAAQNDRDSYVRWRAEKALGRWLTPTDCELMMSYSRYRPPRTFRFGDSRPLTRRPETLPNPAEVEFHVEPVYKQATKIGETNQENEKDSSPTIDGLMAESSPGLGPF